MLLSELKSTKEGKEASILKWLEAGDTKDVPQEILMVDSLFKIFTGGPTFGVPTSSTEYHLLYMFKLLYIFNIPFSLESLPILMKLFVKHTHKHIETVPKKTLRKELKFDYLAEEDLFGTAISAAREVLSEVKPDWRCGLQYEKAIDFCKRFLEVQGTLIQNKTAVIRAEFNEEARFDEATANKTKVFYKEGFYYFPVIPRQEERNVEDFR